MPAGTMDDDATTACPGRAQRAVIPTSFHAALTILWASAPNSAFARAVVRVANWVNVDVAFSNGSDSAAY